MWLRYVSVNAYFVGGGQRVALEVHNDPQCTFIVQLRGRKRWRLWPKRAAMLPVPPQTHENANVRGNRFGLSHALPLENGRVQYGHTSHLTVMLSILAIFSSQAT